MVDVASVPLMDDMEGDEGMGRKDMEGGGGKRKRGGPKSG